MSDDSKLTGHERGVVVTTICCLSGIGVDDFGVKDNLHVAFLTFTLGVIGYTVLATSGVQLVA